MDSQPGIGARVSQTVRLLRSEGSSAVAARLLERAATTLRPPTGGLPVDRQDLLRAAEISASGWQLPGPAALEDGQPLDVAWVCVPPGLGSGGHTTLFRMAAALERSGHRSTIYLYDRHGWSLEQHRERMREWWPWLQADVRNLGDGIADSHAIFASGWLTAYPVLASPARGSRFYFVQDFEPAFFPAGSEALLAEATYRFGFHGVTAGRWLAELLRRDYGMAADHFDFGCDLEHYQLDRSAEDKSGRTGICCYCRASTPRRAHELAMMALDLFAQRRPDVEIHLFGEPVHGVKFPVTQHGLLTPSELGSLYRRCVAGLSLSATNPSLVPYEMLSAGCIPVVNDAEHNRMVLNNDNVVYASPAPFELAGALEMLVSWPEAERAAAALAASASVTGASWEDAGARVEEIIKRVVEPAAALRP